MLWWKRATDLVLALLALALLGPLMLLVALLIKLSSRGPVFYVAPRMGCGGVPFGQLKFRTMHAGAEVQTVEEAAGRVQVLLPDGRRYSSRS